MSSAEEFDSAEVISRDLGELGDSGLDEAARRELLLKLLGPAVARRLGIYRLPEGFVLSVVIPVYNEVRTVAEVHAARAAPAACRREIILVDDGSTDGTRDLLQGWTRPATICGSSCTSRTRAKGRRCETGFAQATGDVVIVQDADLEYDPAEYRRAHSADRRGAGRRGVRQPLLGRRATACSTSGTTWAIAC